MLTKICLMVFFAFAQLAFAEAKIAKGTFLGLEQGDYVHFLIHTQKGDESFFINLKSPSIKQVTENPSRFIGKKCTVKYLETKQHFPEGGGEYDVQLLEEVIWDESPKSSLK